MLDFDVSFPENGIIKIKIKKPFEKIDKFSITINNEKREYFNLFYGACWIQYEIKIKDEIEVEFITVRDSAENIVYGYIKNINKKTHPIYT
jgi:hypothetical protein